MDLLAVPVFLCIVWKMSFHIRIFREDALSLENTRALKGILAVLVVLHHLYQQVQEGRLYFVFDNVGVLCVSLFLFLSGYGLMKRYAETPGYRESILRRRIPSVLIPYLCLILIYWLFSGIRGSFLTLSEVLRSFVGGMPIVSHSWYILCILALYFGFYLSVVLWKRNLAGIIGSTVLLCVLWVLFCRARGFAPYWYNGVILFPVGIFWGAYETQLHGFLRAHYGPALAVSLLGFCGFFPAALVTAGEDCLVSLFWPGCCCFVVLVLLVLMKVRFGNPVLQFLGEISFALYGIHGLFEALYRSPVLSLEDPVLWGSAVLVSSVAAAWVLQRFFRLLLKQILR